MMTMMIMMMMMMWKDDANGALDHWSCLILQAGEIGNQVFNFDIFFSSIGALEMLLCLFFSSSFLESFGFLSSLTISGAV